MDGKPEFDKLFAQAMDSMEALPADSFVTDFDRSCFERIINVGGSKGAKSLAILKCHPHLKALVADREQVIRGAERFWKDRGEGAVLHGIDDDSYVTVLRHIAAAPPPSS